jgi:hypothetical protein
MLWYRKASPITGIFPLSFRFPPPQGGRKALKRWEGRRGRRKEERNGETTLKDLWMDHRAPNGGTRESTQRTKGNCNPIGGTKIWTKQYPGALSLAVYVSKDGLVGPSLQREAHWTCKLYMPQYRGTPGPKRGSGWVGDWGGGYGGPLG